MAILIANTSTTFPRDERLENMHATHGKCNYESGLRCVRDLIKRLVFETLVRFVWGNKP